MIINTHGPNRCELPTYPMGIGLLAPAERVGVVVGSTPNRPYVFWSTET